MSGWNASDALAITLLPSLIHQTPGMVTTIQSQNAEAGDDNADNDDLGDFAGFNNTSSNESPAPAVDTSILGQ